LEGRGHGLFKYTPAFSIVGVRIPAGAGNFSHRHHVQTGSGA